VIARDHHSAPAMVAHGREHSPEPARLPPVAGAKVDLLRCLEQSGACEAPLLAEELLEPRTLRELALRAREISHHIREVDGPVVARTFWKNAKAILLAWRDIAAKGEE
jgi:hypothetical protein